MNTFYGILGKIKEAFSSELGWLIALITSAFVSTQDIKLGIYIVVGAILADLFWGIWAALKMKKFLFSVAFRETFKKAAIYFFALCGAFLLEYMIKADSKFIAYKTFIVLISVCEFWSMSANMLIVKPNTPFLKIMRVQLKGEIQAKVGKNVNIDEILKDDTTNNSNST